MSFGDVEIKVVADWRRPRGEAVFSVEEGTFFAHPFDYMLQLGHGRLPYETPRCAGMRELERDRRRFPR